jgi:hypothetical protein
MVLLFENRFFFPRKMGKEKRFRSRASKPIEKSIGKHDKEDFSKRASAVTGKDFFF